MTSRDEYLSAHHLPRWYPLVAEFTAETHVLPLNADLESELRGLGWGGFFIKDYVKSLKTARGAIVHDPGEIHDLVAEMQAFLGEIEGGLCVRRVEAYKPDTERRYFVLRHQAYAATDDAIPSIVRHVAAKIPSDFFSVDVAERDDGELRVIEIGDGQVSDLVGWTTNRFVEIWKSQTD